MAAAIDINKQLLLNNNKQLPLILILMAAAIKYHWFLLECIYAIWHHLARIFTEAG